MSLSNQQIRDHLQAQLDAVGPNQVFALTPGEYPGPFFIRKSITIDGQGATLWALRGPVLVIEGNAQVEIRNLRVEVTEESPAADSDSDTAIQIIGAANVELEDVEVRGDIQGLAAENGTWRYPKTLYLGHLAPMQDHDFRLRIATATPCKVSSELSGVSVFPSTLPIGPIELTIRVEKMRRDTLLLGRIVLKTAFCKRWFVLNGQVGESHSTAKSAGTMLWEPADWSSLGNRFNPNDIVISAELVPTQGEAPSTPPKPVAVLGPAFSGPSAAQNRPSTNLNQPAVSKDVIPAEQAQPRVSIPVKPSSSLFKVQKTSENPASNRESSSGEIAQEKVPTPTTETPDESATAGQSQQETDAVPSPNVPKLIPSSKFFKKP